MCEVVVNVRKSWGWLVVREAVCVVIFLEAPKRPWRRLRDRGSSTAQAKTILELRILSSETQFSEADGHSTIAGLRNLEDLDIEPKPYLAHLGPLGFVEFGNRSFGQKIDLGHLGHMGPPEANRDPPNANKDTGVSCEWPTQASFVFR